MDDVNQPEHYTQGDIECIQAIEAMLGVDGAIAFCRGNVIKYTWRCMYKGTPTKDLKKAVWYAERARRLMEKKNPIKEVKKKFRLDYTDSKRPVQYFWSECNFEKPETD